jgi:hypothetical protein
MIVTTVDRLPSLVLLPVADANKCLVDVRPRLQGTCTNYIVGTGFEV